MNTDSIEKRIVLHAPLKRVWRALSDSTEFGTWFGMRFDGPFESGKRVGGVIFPTTVDAEIAKAQEEHEGKSFEFWVEEMAPENLLSFRWHPFAVDQDVNYSSEPTTLIEFRLKEVPEGVLLTVRESGFDQIPLERRAKAFSANEQGWTMVMKLIEGYLAANP